MSCPYANKCWRYSYSKYYFEIGYEIPPERQILFFAGYASEEMFPNKGIFAENMPAKGKNIFDNGECTFENKKRYFSYRRDKPEVVEAMIAVIGL